MVALKSRSNPPTIRIGSREEIADENMLKSGVVTDITQEILAIYPARSPAKRAKQRTSLLRGAAA